MFIVVSQILLLRNWCQGLCWGGGGEKSWQGAQLRKPGGGGGGDRSLQVALIEMVFNFPSILAQLVVSDKNPPGWAMPAGGHRNQVCRSAKLWMQLLNDHETFNQNRATKPSARQQSH